LKIILLLSERTTKAYHGFGKSGGSVFRLTVFRMKFGGKFSHFAIRQTLYGYVEVSTKLSTIFSIFILQNQFKMITKEQLIETINQLPLEFSLDEVIDKIVLLEKINKGLQQSQKGKVTRDEDLDKKLPEWLV
jgi:hypothetical protein